MLAFYVASFAMVAVHKRYWRCKTSTSRRAPCSPRSMSRSAREYRRTFALGREGVFAGPISVVPARRADRTGVPRVYAARDVVDGTVAAVSCCAPTSRGRGQVGLPRRGTLLTKSIAERGAHESRGGPTGVPYIAIAPRRDHSRIYSRRAVAWIAMGARVDEESHAPRPRTQGAVPARFPSNLF